LSGRGKGDELEGKLSLSVNESVFYFIFKKGREGGRNPRGPRFLPFYFSEKCCKALGLEEWVRRGEKEKDKKAPSSRQGKRGKESVKWETPENLTP